MDIGWIQVLTLIGANLLLIIASIGTTITLFLWARSEAREDRVQFNTLLQAIQNEMKDFHGRLCTIEANRLEGKQ